MFKSKDNLIFLHKFLKAIADSIIQVFIPLFILKQTGELWLSITYLAVYSLFVFINISLLKKLIQSRTVLCIIFHFIPIIISQCLLSFLSINVFVVLGCALLMSVAQALYSVPINLVFAFSDSSTNVAKFQIGTNFAKLLFILISGFIISTSSSSVALLSIVSSVFYIACVVPILFAYNELKNNYNAAIQKDKAADMKKKVDKKFVLFHIGFGCFQATIDYIIPLFLFINNLSFQAVTIIMALVELMRILSNYIAKYLVKINKQRLSCIISCSIFLVSLICLVTFKIPVLLYICTCLCSISFPLTFVPMFKKYCNYLIETDNIFDGMTERDLEIFSFRPLVYLAALTGLGMYPSFVLGLIAMIIMFTYQMKLTRKSKEDINQSLNNNKNGEELWN